MSLRTRQSNARDFGHKYLPGWIVFNGSHYVTTARTKEHADRFIAAMKSGLKHGTQVRASSGFIGAVRELELDYHSGDVQYIVEVKGFIQSDGKEYNTCWGSSLEGTKPIGKLFKQEKLP